MVRKRQKKHLSLSIILLLLIISIGAGIIFVHTLLLPKNVIMQDDVILQYTTNVAIITPDGKKVSPSPSLFSSLETGNTPISAVEANFSWYLKPKYMSMEEFNASIVTRFSFLVYVFYVDSGYHNISIVSSNNTVTFYHTDAIINTRSVSYDVKTAVDNWYENNKDIFSDQHQIIIRIFAYLRSSGTDKYGVTWNLSALAKCLDISAYYTPSTSSSDGGSDGGDTTPPPTYPWAPESSLYMSSSANTSFPIFIIPIFFVSFIIIFLFWQKRRKKY